VQQPSYQAEIDSSYIGGTPQQAENIDMKGLTYLIDKLHRQTTDLRSMRQLSVPNPADQYAG
jgi:hypothetical protein